MYIFRYNDWATWVNTCKKNNVLNDKKIKNLPCSAAISVNGTKTINSSRTATANWLLLMVSICVNERLIRAGTAATAF
ncbi:hypothetical protein D3C73_1601050 [compost metagenome]